MGSTRAGRKEQRRSTSSDRPTISRDRFGVIAVSHAGQTHRVQAVLGEDGSFDVWTTTSEIETLTLDQLKARWGWEATDAISFLARAGDTEEVVTEVERLIGLGQDADATKLVGQSLPALKVAGDRAVPMVVSESLGVPDAGTYAQLASALENRAGHIPS